MVVIKGVMLPCARELDLSPVCGSTGTAGWLLCCFLRHHTHCEFTSRYIYNNTCLSRECKCGAIVFSPISIRSRYVAEMEAHVHMDKPSI